MVVRDRAGFPLPDGHPFKGMQVHFGMRPPKRSQVANQPAMAPEGSTPSLKALHDLQNLPEDPAIRPMLISHCVPRDMWPQGYITAAQAEELIRQYGSKT